MYHKIRLGILQNEQDDDHLFWIKSCEDLTDIVCYDVINLTANNWLEQLSIKNFDYLLAKPGVITSQYKQLYDERIYIIDTVLKLPIYPSPIEIYIYENKRFFYSWLKANNLPHPSTNIFYNKDEAMKFINNYPYTLVAKFNIGATGSGVKILKAKTEKIKYIKDSFSSGGAPKRWGPNLVKGNLIKRGLNYIYHPMQIGKKIVIYDTKRTNIQKGFLILQEYIEHEFEWRVVVIGDSYFAHKKLKIGEKASGTSLKNYDNPPLYLFDFAKEIMDRFRFFSQAIDIFESQAGVLLINEMQCLFGQSDPFQMLVDGIPGRYRYTDKNWVFEEGNFNEYQSYKLRVKHIIEILKNKASD